MVKIPPGTYSLGSKLKQDNNPVHEFITTGFYIDKYEVTNEEYHAFILASGHELPKGWTQGAPPKGTGKMPVVGINAEDAAVYAVWKGKRLPTEDEWETAARGLKNATYPWGDNWGTGFANVVGRQVAQVGNFPKDVSSFGVFDLAGNVSEWTATRGAKNGAEYAVRGGSFKDISHATARTTFRDFREGKDKKVNLGFRCARDSMK
jgi:formylglycine-generating enzyme required for sulfatase activity